MYLFHEYSSSQPNMMCLQHILKLPERYEAYLLYKVCSWLQRRQQDGSSVLKTIRLQGKDLHILTRAENAGTEEHDKSTVRSDLNRQAIPKRFGSAFSREFITKDRLSYDISYDRFPNSLNCMNIHM
ncbi:hypothetical protein DPMN_087134 [Dreissena polymorpha]|uniref:Uncharacterized protein n=1 Tax=Dreissena polymorpha TaxID=45954 RepID=A0A9D4KRP4_DREPO|nr:hypothetical protein DPMN_087134 [Dreissena polymorpha]